LTGLNREGVNFWAVDVKGKEYRETCIKNNDLVLPSHRIKINPLQAPDWIRKEDG